MSPINKVRFVVSFAIILSLAFSGAALGATAPAAAKGPTARQVVGVVTSVDAQNRALVVEVPHAKNQTLTVGVSFDAEPKVAIGGKKASLGDVKVGDRVRLGYVRTENRLVGKSVQVLGAKK